MLKLDEIVSVLLNRVAFDADTRCVLRLVCRTFKEQVYIEEAYKCEDLAHYRSSRSKEDSGVGGPHLDWPSATVTASKPAARRRPCMLQAY